MRRPGGAALAGPPAAATVVVDGATRVGAPLAAVLAASGIGRVQRAGRAVWPTAGDAVVGGLGAADEGRPRSLAAADAVRRASPLTDLRPLPPRARARPGRARPAVGGVRPAGRRAAPRRAAAPGRDRARRDRRRRAARGARHAPAACAAGTCTAGTPTRAWPRLAAQLTAAEPPPSGATVTCLLTAVTAAVQVLAYLDGGAAPAALDATLELRRPSCAPAAAVAPHPACGCARRGGRHRGRAREPLPGSHRAPPPAAAAGHGGDEDGPVTRAHELTRDEQAAPRTQQGRTPTRRPRE